MTKTVWAADMNRLNASVAPYLMDIDGQTFISTDAPAPLVSLYSKLTSIGYANGWV